MERKPSRWTKLKAAALQFLCVLFMNGHEDEMLSSFSYRTKNKRLIRFIDGLLGDGHCKESFVWEQQRPRSAERHFE